MGRVSGRLSGAWPTRERYISPTRPAAGRPSGGRHDYSGYFRTPPCAQISTIPAPASLGARYDRFLLRVRPASHPGTSIPVAPGRRSPGSRRRPGKCISAAMSSGAMIRRGARGAVLGGLVGADPGGFGRRGLDEMAAADPVASRMFVTFIDGVILGWLADRNDEQALDA